MGKTNRILFAAALVAALVLTGGAAAWAQCASIDLATANITLPYVDVLGTPYEIVLAYLPFPADPTALLWTFSSFKAGAGEGISTILDMTLKLDIPCLDVGGIKYRVILDWFTHASLPAGLYWRFSSVLPAMELTSSAFSHGAFIPPKYSCDAADAGATSPPLSVSSVPAGTQSLALVMDDPDAPGGTFVHWLIWNLAPATTAIAENAVPPGSVEGNNDLPPGMAPGRLGYFGPCPPAEHRYFFKLYALDTMLALGSGSSKAQLLAAMAGHIISQAELMGRYK